MLYYIYMKTTTQQQKILYGILALVVGVLVVLIGWFIYLLFKPATPSTTTNENVVITNATANQNVPKTTVNTNTTTNDNSNLNANTNTNNTNSNSSNTSSNSNTNGDGLVEPDTNSNTNSNANTNVSAPEGPTYSSSNTDATTETLYFAKSGGSCGEVGAVQRSFTPGDDPYGQIILDDMRGPTAEETGYVDGIPSTIKLKQVQYTASGSVITVNEAYNDLSDCDKKTVDAQFIKTANTMFDVSPEAAGEVVVGEATTETETNSNSNTNQ